MDSPISMKISSENYDLNSRYVNDYRSSTEIRRQELPLNMLKLFVSGISAMTSDEGNPIKECIDAVGDDKASQDLIKNIRAEVAKGSRQGVESIEVDLKENGKYKLMGDGNGLVIKKSSENCNDLDVIVAQFNDSDLAQFIKKFKHAKINEVINDFVVVDIDYSDSEEEFEIINKSALDNCEFPNYLKPGNKLGEESFTEAVNVFLDRNRIPLKRQDDGSIIFNDFELYPLISNKDNKEVALEFIQNHKDKNSLILVPYCVTGRGVYYEDHVVLLAIKSEQSVVIDPKFGHVLGIIKKHASIRGLNWQNLGDFTNCGFYVYHMIISAITAPVESRISDAISGGQLADGLKQFFKSMNEPTPDEIRENMIRLYDPQPTEI